MGKKSKSNNNNNKKVGVAAAATIGSGTPVQNAESFDEELPPVDLSPSTFEVCGICKESLPPMKSWKREMECSMLVCCGKFICFACQKSTRLIVLHASPKLNTADGRDSLTSGSGLTIREELIQPALMARCPVCYSVHDGPIGLLGPGRCLRLATAGHAYAQFRHGVALDKRSSDCPENCEKAKKWLKTAATNGCIPAWGYMGSLYESEGAYDRAKICFEIGGRHHCPRALTDLADMYVNGRGVESNVEKAEEYYRLAVESLLPSAIESYGMFLINRKRITEAISVCEGLAVQEGLARVGDKTKKVVAGVQFMLGFSYTVGCGCDDRDDEGVKAEARRRYTSARFWLHQAARKGCPGAKDSLESIIDGPEKGVCGFCSLPDPLGGRCSNCNVVAYCDSNCQNKHWEKSHRRECKALKKLIQELHASLEDACGFCRKPNPNNRCSQCKTPYCNEVCQTAHYHEHKEECKKLSSDAKLLGCDFFRTFENAGWGAANTGDDVEV